MKRVLSVVLSLIMCVSLLVGCGNKSKEEDPGENGKYKIAVSNAYMGNDWRQLMIKCLEDVYKRQIIRFLSTSSLCFLCTFATVY